jgi:hypothetical protein
MTGQVRQLLTCLTNVWWYASRDVHEDGTPRVGSLDPQGGLVATNPRTDAHEDDASVRTALAGPSEE